MSEDTLSREERRLSTAPRHDNRLNQLVSLIRDRRIDEARRLWARIKHDYSSDHRTGIVHVINYVRSKVGSGNARVFIELFYDYFNPIIRRYVGNALKYVDREPRWINILEAYAAKLYIEVMLFGDHIASSVVRFYLLELKDNIRKRIRMLLDSCTTLECIEEKVNWILRELKRKENVHLSRHLDFFEKLVLDSLLDYRDRIIELLERDSRKLRAMYGYSASNIKRHFPYTTRFLENDVICEKIASMGDRLFKRKCT